MLETSEQDSVMHQWSERERFARNRQRHAAVLMRQQRRELAAKVIFFVLGIVALIALPILAYPFVHWWRYWLGQ